MRKYCVSYVLLDSDVEIIEKPMVFFFFKDFGISRGGRAHVARMVLFDKDSCPGRMTGVSRVHRAVT